MLVNRSVKKVIVVLLAGAAVAGATEVGTGVIGRGAAAASTNNYGNPHAVPPILRPATASELEELRSAEARQGLALYGDAPASARYSGAAFNVFAK